MHKYNIFALVFTIASVCVTAYPSHGYKRGVVAVGVNCADLEVLAPGASWYYQYGHAPDPDIAACAHRLGLEYVPMQKAAATISSLGHDLPSDTMNFLGFNEPNSPSQANLSPEAAAQDWMNQVIPQLRQANYRGRIGTPSPAIGKTPGPLEWYTRFFAACTDCHFDFIATHYYGDELFYLQQLVSSLNTRFDLPIWVTEFARPRVSQALEERFMTNTVAWMEKTQYIERYSWFSARNSPSGFTGAETSLLQQGASALTPLGRLYISLPFQVPDSTTVTSSTVTISVTTSTTAGITSSTSASVKSTSTGTVSAHASTTKTSASLSKASHSASTSTAKASTIHAASAHKASTASAHKASTLAHA